MQFDLELHLQKVAAVKVLCADGEERAVGVCPALNALGQLEEKKNGVRRRGWWECVCVCGHAFSLIAPGVSVCVFCSNPHQRGA